MARLKKIVKSLSSLFQAIKYGSGSREGDNIESGFLPEMKGVKKGGVKNSQRRGLSRELSASDGNLHRKKRQAPLAHSQSFATQKSFGSLNSKSVSDVPRLVAHVIEEASTSTALLNHSPLMTREPIRVINGSRPSLQSQVLLNTKTSQPFEDLVKDLALSVRVPKQPIGNFLKTLAGRHIKSYSQLRSELKAGQRAFFVYSENKPVAASTLRRNDNARYSNRNGKPLVKAALGKVNSNSSSDLSIAADTNRKSHQQRRRSHSPRPSLQVTPRFANSRSPSPYDFNQ